MLRRAKHSISEFCLFLTLPGIIPRQKVGKLQSIAKGIKSPMRYGEEYTSKDPRRLQIGQKLERFPFHLPLSLMITYRSRVVSCRVARHARYTHICTYVNRESTAPRTIGTRTVFCSAWSHYRHPHPMQHHILYIRLLLFRLLGPVLTRQSSSSCFARSSCTLSHPLDSRYSLSSPSSRVHTHAYGPLRFPPSLSSPSSFAYGGDNVVSRTQMRLRSSFQ